MSTRRARAPRDHVVSGHWPRATLDGDHAAVTAQTLAQALETALRQRGWSLAELHRRAGINRQTIANVLDGRAWVTVAVLADLEQTLEQPLWPQK